MINICMTHDLDWASDFVIDNMLELLDKHSIISTIFCTHKVKINKHELGIHPYFKHGEQAEDETFQNILNKIPNAKGSRSHRLLIHNNLFNHYKKFGLDYDSNCLMQNQLTQPFFTFKGVLEFPIYYEDDLSFYPHNSLNPLKLSSELLKLNNATVTFNFHPIHLYLNTKSLAHYEKARPDLNNEKNLKKHINNGYGVKTKFLELLKILDDHLWNIHYNYKTLGEINKKIRESVNND